MYFLIYENLKSFALQHEQKERLSTLESFTFGATGGMVSNTSKSSVEFNTWS